MAVSIPGELFDSAESLGTRLKVSRSRLYATAIAEFLAKHRAGDARAVNLQITPAGRDAVQASSVLDATRVRALLKALSTMERRQAVSGLAHLARAAGQGAAGRPT